MSKIGVSFNLDVKKIDKARLHVGDKGTYLNFTTFIDIDQKDNYGNNGMVTQDVSKDEREGGVKGNILGNCKVFWSDINQSPPQTAQQQAAPQQQAPPEGVDDFDDDIPF